MTCPTPDKIAFRSKVDALIKAKSVEDWHGTPMKVYPCGCGRWHLSSQVNGSSSEQPSDASS